MIREKVLKYRNDQQSTRGWVKVRDAVLNRDGECSLGERGDAWRGRRSLIRAESATGKE